MVELDLRLDRPAAPRDTVGAVARRRWDAGVLGAKGGELVGVERLQRGGRIVRATRVDVQCHLEPLGRVGGRLFVGQRGADVYVRAGPHAFPVLDRATWRAIGDVIVKPARSSPVAMIVAGHDYHCLQALGKVPETRQGLAVQVHVQDQVGQQALLLVGLGDSDLVQVDPVGLGVRAGRTIEHVVGAQRRDTIPFLPDPGRIALPRVYDRAGQVVSERGRLPAV